MSLPRRSAMLVAAVAALLLPTAAPSGPTGAIRLAVPDPHNCSAQCSGPPHPLSTAVPNVLLLSDSIGANGTGYYANVKDMLGPGSASTGGGAIGNALVQHVGGYGKGICGTSYGAVACLPLWLGSQPWDVIHFNWGLHDICAQMYAPVTNAEYVVNMGLMYQALKAAIRPNGTLIWTTTTPVPPSYMARNNTDVVRINGDMAKLFGPGSEHPDVRVHDLYGEIVARCQHSNPGYPQAQDCDVIQSRGVHMSDAGKQMTGIMTAASIATSL